MGFSEGDPIQVQIVHHLGCTPKTIYNPPAPKKSVELLAMEVDSTYTLRWKTKGEAYTYTYIIEQFRWNKWVRIGEVSAQGNYQENAYSFQLLPHSGENQVRVKYYSIQQQPHLSKTVKFSSGTIQPDCWPKQVKDTLHLGSETLYEVYDTGGNMVMKGSGSYVYCKKLPKGVYYINYDNTSKEFIKQ